MSDLKGIDKKNLKISEENINKLLQYIDSVEFGSVTVFIQEGKVVQIEKSEKIKIK